MKEKDYYPAVVDFLINKKKCLAAKSGQGHYYVGYADAFGIKDIGGQFNAQVIGYAIEVKTSKSSFGKNIGQALGYSLFSHRCYLAVPETFEEEHIEMANRLGVGLIEINGKKCEEVLTARHHEPIEDLFLIVCETMGWSKCSICGEFFKHNGEWTRQNPAYAIEKQKYYYHQIKKDYVYYTKSKKQKRDSLYMCKKCLLDFSGRKT